ncbi:MAG TPA: endolytic transglycosylase MltG, partial [Jatrophihabitans sp.]
RESVAPGTPGDDPHSLLFGDEDTGEFAPEISRAERRRDEHRHRRGRRRRGRLFVLLAVVIVAAVAYFVVPKVIDYFSVADYSGQGSGTVSITVNPGDTTADIGNTLQHQSVVKSAQAFTDACGASTCAGIQPGTYLLRLHMSGAAAVALITSNAARDTTNDLVIPEGATGLDVQTRLAKIFHGQSAKIAAAMKNAGDLGLPRGYTGKGSGIPTSVEGFLYPATYRVDPAGTPTKVLANQVIPRFLEQDRQTHFADDAAKIHLTPYDALIIASIAQSEAKFTGDMPKVARTILNRIKDGRPLQFDSTSSYACKLAGTPASKCIYHQVDSPYNTYTHKGLPPTPIDNPGAPAMSAAVAPANGNYTYFVNIDGAGHLGFFSSAKDFEKAREKCVKQHWGCG